MVGERGEIESDSVRSDSLRPHGLYSPLNSPGQNTGVGSLSLLQGIFPTQVSHIASGFFTSWATRESVMKFLKHRNAYIFLKWQLYYNGFLKLLLLCVVLASKILVLCHSPNISINILSFSPDHKQTSFVKVKTHQDLRCDLLSRKLKPSGFQHYLLIRCLQVNDKMKAGRGTFWWNAMTSSPRRTETNLDLMT